MPGRRRASPDREEEEVREKTREKVHSLAWPREIRGKPQERTEGRPQVSHKKFKHKKATKPKFELFGLWKKERTHWAVSICGREEDGDVTKLAPEATSLPLLPPPPPKMLPSSRNSSRAACSFLAEAEERLRWTPKILSIPPPVPKLPKLSLRRKRNTISLPPHGRHKRGSGWTHSSSLSSLSDQALNWSGRYTLLLFSSPIRGRKSVISSSSSSRLRRRVPTDTTPQFQNPFSLLLIQSERPSSVFLPFSQS